jgi:hypothetical protein
MFRRIKFNITLATGGKTPALYTSRLAWSFYHLSQSIPSVVFFCHTFCEPTLMLHIAILVPAVPKSSPKAQAKSRFTPTTTAVSLVQEKNSKLIYLIRT